MKVCSKRKSAKYTPFASSFFFGGLPRARFGGASTGAGSSDSVPDDPSSKSGRGMAEGTKFASSLPSSSLASSAMSSAVCFTHWNPFSMTSHFLVTEVLGRRLGFLGQRLGLLGLGLCLSLGRLGALGAHGRHRMVMQEGGRDVARY